MRERDRVLGGISLRGFYYCCEVVETFEKVVVTQSRTKAFIRKSPELRPTGNSKKSRD